MSIEVMTRVWKHSAQKGGNLLALLALADFSNEHGISWPAISTLAQRSRMKERNLRYALNDLETAGELLRISKAGRGAHCLFLITLRLSEDQILKTLVDHAEYTEESARLLLEQRKEANIAGFTDEKEANFAGLNDDKRGKDCSIKKGANFAEKVQSLPKKVQKTTLKPAKSCMPYKEEPSGTVKNTPEGTDVPDASHQNGLSQAEIWKARDALVSFHKKHCAGAVTDPGKQKRWALWLAENFEIAECQTEYERQMQEKWRDHVDWGTVAKTLGQKESREAVNEQARQARKSPPMTL